MLNDNSKPLVIFHANCPDGFGAAFAAWLKFGEGAEYLPYDYDGTPAPSVHGRAVYILDFAFDGPTMERLESEAHRVVLLDHHQTGIDKLAGFRCICAEQRLGPNQPRDPHNHSRFSSFWRLDVSKSGARLAWEYFHGQSEVPALIQHVEDRDLHLGQFGDNGRFYLASLDSCPRTFASWKAVLDMEKGEDAAEKMARFIGRGKAMCAYYDQLIDRLVKDARPLNLLGAKGLLANAARELADDVGGALATRSGTFGAVWSVEGQLVKVSLRGAPDFDARAIAEQFGGGGHAQVCAFRLPLGRLGELLDGSIETV